MIDEPEMRASAALLHPDLLMASAAVPYRAVRGGQNVPAMKPKVQRVAVAALARHDFRKWLRRLPEHKGIALRNART
eukprot:CAMPEP_0170194744 /NCGR_PEP_ID=MMETSP0040_2-20121228/59941_1 /TAXON_ID=641309 /ORGANISM="Lotharella oceanica, Strain CCMP622" /LENGTH=76 /DNA_ID=CAMNT_0010443719 /DNA_START=163 /DNA_END=394 /DNA_ORIENTATION=-